MSGLPHWGRNLWLNSHAGFLVFAVLLIIAVAWTYARFVNRPGGRSKKPGVSRASSSVVPAEKAVSPKTAFGEFQPRTEAERELEKMLQGKDEHIDLALANWLIAAAIPQFHDLTREHYFAQLDGMIAQMRQEMAGMEKVAASRGNNPSDANTRCAIFCNAMVKLGFSYAEDFRQENVTPALLKSLYSDANNLFLAGLLRTRRGSCVSMPLLYLVIGQRLDLPVHLVAIGKHYFIRWEEPGYRMNIETTIVEKVSVTPDDSVYLEAECLTREQLKGTDLRNLARREVVANLLFVRSAHWATKGVEHKTQQRLDLARAHHLAPDDFGIRTSYEAVSNAHGIKPEPTSIELKPTVKKGNSI